MHAPDNTRPDGRMDQTLRYAGLPGLIPVDTLGAMPNRRNFLKDAARATAGVLFCGCNLLPAQQTPAAGKRRQVKIGGRRVKTIDVHAHCTIPEATALMP